MEPIVKKDIEARIKDTGDIMTGKLIIDLPNSETLGEGLVITPSGNLAEGGQITLNANKNSVDTNGIVLDNIGGKFRIYGVASVDGITKKGYGDSFLLDPYALGTSVQHAILHTGNISSYIDLSKALLIDGSNSMTSNGLQIANGWGQLWCNNQGINIFSRITAGGNYGRYFSVFNQKHCDIKYAARIIQLNEDNTTQGYNLYGDHNYQLTFPEIYNNSTRCVNILNFVGDNNTNIHKAPSEFSGELNLYRFFAAGDENNFSSLYSLPCVDSHAMVFSIDSNTNWIRLLNFDMRSSNIFTQVRTNGTWGGWKRVWIEGNTITGAVWNDYAECRESSITKPGLVLKEKGDDTLIPTEERLSHFCGVSSDTYGFSQGETDKAKTPIAVAGRVLVYTFEPRDTFEPGDCVCAGPGGTVSKMTRQEIIEWPDRIVGKVSCVPDYEIWGGGEGADREPVQVDGRIWIQVK